MYLISVAELGEQGSYECCRRFSNCRIFAGFLSATGCYLGLLTQFHVTHVHHVKIAGRTAKLLHCNCFNNNFCICRIDLQYTMDDNHRQ